jgi:hypothetical protein
MALDPESFDILLSTVQRFVRERWSRPRTTWKSTTRCRPNSSRT